jgi:TolA-binding protein
MNWGRVIPTRLGGCPAGWKLSRAFVEGGHSEVTVHLRVCSRCSHEWDSLARVSAATSELPAIQIAEETRLLIEARLLGEAAIITRRATSSRLPSSWPRAAAIALLASGAATAAVIGARRHAAHDEGAVTAVASLASIRAVGAATFSRLQAPPDEILRLDSGTLEITVAAPLPGRRFRIATDDAVVDASEGRFSIEAGARTLVAVRVFAGYAEVRASGGHATLHAGDEWARASSHVATSSAEEKPRPRAQPTVAPHASSLPVRAVAALDKDTRALTPTPKASPLLPATVTAPQRASFERGWRLLRSGDPLHAAEAFQDVDKDSGGDAISEDALFWEAVSLARAGLAPAARASLAGFVARYPRSVRVGEASAMLGWMLLESGDASGARHAFERAATDRVDRVRASAQAGLARLSPP